MFCTLSYIQNGIFGGNIRLQYEIRLGMSRQIQHESRLTRSAGIADFAWENTVKQITVSFFVFLATIFPAAAAETTDRGVGLLDTHPECMERNGPDCVLPAAIAPPRTAAPQGVAVAPPVVPPVIVPPSVPIETPPAPPITLVPGIPAPFAPAPPIKNAPSTPTEAGPAQPAQRSTIISPRTN